MSLFFMDKKNHIVLVWYKNCITFCLLTNFSNETFCLLSNFISGKEDTEEKEKNLVYICFIVVNGLLE